MTRHGLPRTRKALRAENAAIVKALTDCIAERDDLRHELRIADDALEAERQWRITSLPTLLASESRAEKAEAEVERIKRVGYAGPGYALVRIDADDRPWASTTEMAASLADQLAYTESVTS